MLILILLIIRARVKKVEEKSSRVVEKSRALRSHSQLIRYAGFEKKSHIRLALGSKHLQTPRPTLLRTSDVLHLASSEKVLK